MGGDMCMAAFHIFAALRIHVMKPEKKGKMEFYFLVYIWENEDQIPGADQVMERPRALAMILK